MVRVTVPVDSPLAHGAFLHGAGKGYVSLGRKTKARPPYNWHQHSYALEELPEVLPRYLGAEDVYISQNRFYGSRSVSRLAELSSLYADVDFYKRPDLAPMHPRGVLKEAFAALERARIPRPSLAVATGRGLSLVWLHEPVPRPALPRWDACQRHIHEALKGLGADPMAKDAARVFRLVGTRNSKTGVRVETLWVDPKGAWSFDDLAEEILPLSREELEELRDLRQAQRKGAKKGTDRRGAARNRLTIATLHEARLGDLQRLVRLRGTDELPSGQRDPWMFAAAVSLSYLAEPHLLGRELFAIGRETAGWSESETRSRMQAVLRRAVSAGEGGTVQRAGEPRDPRYKLSTPRIIEMLEITAAEEKEMEVTISPDTKRGRGRMRKEKKRRALGAKPRGQYLADNREAFERNRTSALALHDEGASLRDIGRRLGVSHTQAKRLLEGKM
ncbi:MAG: hypothetical protein M3P49_15355 [Actinomycetota bacterium]|nr:hypothetical protein [Actinomycetota bacterium]